MRRKFSDIALIFIAVFVFSTGKTEAQRVIYENSTDTTAAIPKVGPNRLFFFFPTYYLCTESFPVSYGYPAAFWSAGAGIDLNFKLKLWSWESLVWSAGLRHDHFGISQKQVKLPPLSPDRHKREKIVTDNFTFSFSDRINFGKRGNVIGAYAEFGVTGSCVFRTSYVYVDQYFDSNGPGGRQNKVKIKSTGLAYLEPFTYGPVFRIGMEYYSISLQYRYNNLIRSAYSPNGQDLPKLMLSFEYSRAY
ncbi:MAG TPA: hypothetical protein VFU15_05200 [Bacteroidia bacterium]|nr:hypothetical protein [Bacteroidia bacterium]